MANTPITAASSSTPISGSAPYCSGTQFVTLFFDARTAADLLSDTGTPIGWNAATATVDPVTVAANATLASLLQAASGKFEAALQVGGRYTPGDLILLTTGGMATGNMAYLIAEVVAGITIPMLYRRRPTMDMPKLEIVEESKEFLAALADGHAVLGILENMTAGVTDDPVEQLADVQWRNMTTYQARRLFGSRTKWRNTPETN